MTLTLVALSATFYYGAYALGTVLFFILYLKQGSSLRGILLQEKSFIFMAAALLLSTVFSKTLAYSLLIDGLILIHMMVYIVIVRTINKENIDQVLQMLNMLGIIICLYGGYQYFTGDLTVDSSWTDTKTFGSLIRIYSTLRNPNILAAYLTFNICYAGAYFIKKKADIYTAVNIMLSSICLILTYSRGGFFAFVAAMLVLTVLCRDAKTAAYTAVMILLYFGYNYYESINRIDFGMLVADSSSQYRVEIWKASFELFKENMAFGSGPGSVMQLLSYSSDKLKGFISHAHNIEIHLLAETGVLGLTTFGGMVVSGMVKAFRFYRIHKNHEDSFVAIGFVAAMTAMLVHGLVDCAVFVPSRSLVFLIYLSLFPAVYYSLHEKHSGKVTSGLGC